MKSSQTDHRTRVTKGLIRRALLTLLQQKPIESISIKELSAAAGIHRATFYTHYDDIYALMAQIEADMVEDLSQAIAPIYETTTDERFLVDICAGIFQCLKDNADFCVVMLGPYSDKRFLDSLLLLGKETCVKVYSQHFQGATQRQIEYFYAFVSSGCMGLLRQWIHDGMSLSAQDLAKMAEQIMLRGIGFFGQAT